MKTFSFLSLLLALSITAHAQFKGNVYIDINQSGIFDKGDKPLAGVAVTDGRHVALTDKSGKFSLPGYEKTRFITLTTPAGFEAQQFYQATKENKKAYDFPLAESKRTSNRAHSFLQITDTETTGGLGRWVTDLQQYIANEKPAFLIHTGDICYEAGQKMHIQVVNAKTMNCPVYYCIGNHDLVKGNYGEELYESLYGPVWYSFDVGNMHYVVTPIDHGDHPTDYTREDVYQWLKNDLASMKKGQSLILFNHDLLTYNDTFVFKGNDPHAIDFRDFNAKALLYGHMHYNYVRNQNGIYTLCTGSLDKGGIDHSSSTFREIDIDDNDHLSTGLRYAFVEPQAAIVFPMDGQQVRVANDNLLPISANIYHSQAKALEVSYTLSTQEDNREQVLSKGTLAPLTDWNWTGNAPIPSSNNGKKLHLAVTSRFSNGKTMTTASQFFYQSGSNPTLINGDNWNTLLQNAAHTGGNNNSQVKLPLQQLWVANAGSNIFMTSPLIADGKVFIATADDNVSLDSHICAFALATGKPQWKYHTENSIKNSIAYENGIIVAQDAACNLYAIDAQSGKLLWKQPINLDSYPYLTEGLTTSNGIVYAGIGAGLSAFDLKTGRIIWTNKDWKQREGATTTLTIAGDVLVSGTQWGGLYGNDIHTGKLRWKLSDNGLGNRGASPVYVDGQLWIISSKSLFAIEPQTGKIILQKEQSANLDVTSTPLITKNEIIFGTADRGIMALDKSTFFTRWKAETQPSLIYTAPYTTTPQAGVETSPVASGETVYIGASDGYLYALDPYTGIIKDKWNLGAPVLSTVAVSGNTLVVSDFSGNIYCFISSIQQ